jgi:hypothetical protein
MQQLIIIMEGFKALIFVEDIPLCLLNQRQEN